MPYNMHICEKTFCSDEAHVLQNGRLTPLPRPPTPWVTLPQPPPAARHVSSVPRGLGGPGEGGSPSRFLSGSFSLVLAGAQGPEARSPARCPPPAVPLTSWNKQLGAFLEFLGEQSFSENYMTLVFCSPIF